MLELHGNGKVEDVKPRKQASGVIGNVMEKPKVGALEAVSSAMCPLGVVGILEFHGDQHVGP
jgi:hypothetical protein